MTEMDDAEILNAPCNELLAPDSSIRCTLPVGHDDPLHYDERTSLHWGELSAVDAIVDP